MKITNIPYEKPARRNGTVVPKELASEKFCEEELEVSHNINWSNFLREICAGNLLRILCSKVGDPGIRTKICFPKERNHVGRVLPQWLFGGIVGIQKTVFGR